MTWEINIKRVNNGFILSHMETNDLGEKIPEEVLFENYFDDSNNDTLHLTGIKDSLARAMEKIIEHFDLRFNKHYTKDDLFIQIKLVDGETYESEMQ